MILVSKIDSKMTVYQNLSHSIPEIYKINNYQLVLQVHVKDSIHYLDNLTILSYTYTQFNIGLKPWSIDPFKNRSISR
jgi:hypothetical protein